MSLLHTSRSAIKLLAPIGARFVQGLPRYHKRRLYPEAIANWRKRKGLPVNPNAYGQLTDLPDYTFLDGRRTPPTRGQLTRAAKQRELTEQIMKLTAEVDYAVERHMRAQAEEATNRENIIKEKLKPKSRPFEAESAAADKS